MGAGDALRLVVKGAICVACPAAAPVVIASEVARTAITGIVRGGEGDTEKASKVAGGMAGALMGTVLSGGADLIHSKK